MGVARILFISDTHLGFDYPFRPRIQRRRRGPDFFANFNRALEPAIRGEVDCVIHGGDILYRSKVPAGLVDMAFEPLRRVADNKVPVFVVPGNHERSAIPYRLLAQYPHIHIFDQPQTFSLNTGDITIAISGFPYERTNVRGRFPGLVRQTGGLDTKADCRLLCVHHCVEGATVGPGNYTFRYNDDVIRVADIPGEFAAVLSGHIHRHQILTKDLNGNPLDVTVFYPGSVERTSFAEKDEAKGYLILEIGTNGSDKGHIVNWVFHELPARPMVQLVIRGENMTGKALAEHIEETLLAQSKDSVVKIRIHGKLGDDALETVRADSIRKLSPQTMNVQVNLADYRARKKDGLFKA
ncbi:exonuclease SbcCD subunit D [Candidatus Latescibacterota bacterium]